MEQGGGGSVRRRVPDRDAVCAQPGVDRFERLARGRIEHGRVAVVQVILEGRAVAIGGARVGACLEEFQHRSRIVDQGGLVQRRGAAAVVRIEPRAGLERSEEQTSEIQSLMRISYAVFCLKKKNKQHTLTTY